MVRGDGGKNGFSRILIICCFSIGSMVLARGMAGGSMLGFSCQITFIYFLKLDQIVEKRTNHNKTMQNNRKNVTMRGLTSVAIVRAFNPSMSFSRGQLDQSVKCS
jgi:hypothetical protein